MMYLCDGPCTSSGLKANNLACKTSKEKETIALALWKAKLNVIEIWFLTSRVLKTLEKKILKISPDAVRPYCYL